MDKLKEQLFAALQRYYPGTDDDWEFDAAHQRLIAKPGTLRQMANGNIQTIQYGPNEIFEWDHFYKDYVHVSELSDFQRWVHEAMANNEGIVSNLRRTWADIGILTIDRDTREPIEIANRICAEKMLRDFKTWEADGQKQYDLSRQAHWGPGWISTISIQMLTEEGEPTEIARFCWDNFVKPLAIDEVQILDDQLYHAVEYYHDLDLIESCLGRKVDRDDPKKMPEFWQELDLNLNENREYPLWVFELHRAITDIGQEMSPKVIEEVAREKGLITDES